VPCSATYNPKPQTLVTPHRSFEAIRSIGRFVFGKYAKANAQKLPTGVSRVLVRVIDSDTDTDNRVCAMNCLNNMAMHVLASVLADNEAVACALRVIQEQGTGAHPFAPTMMFAPAAQSHLRL